MKHNHIIGSEHWTYSCYNEVVEIVKPKMGLQYTGLGGGRIKVT